MQTPQDERLEALGQWLGGQKAVAGLDLTTEFSTLFSCAG